MDALLLRKITLFPEDIFAFQNNFHHEKNKINAHEKLAFFVVDAVL